MVKNKLRDPAALREKIIKALTQDSLTTIVQLVLDGDYPEMEKLLTPMYEEAYRWQTLAELQAEHKAKGLRKIK